MVAPSSWPAPVPVGGGVPDIGGVLGAITCKLELLVDTEIVKSHGQNTTTGLQFCY